VTGNSSTLTGQLLIAMPTLLDPNFWRTVVVLGAHSPEDGAFGLVINRELDVPMASILEELGQEAPEGTALPPVMSGGPVEPTHGFVIFERGGGEAADDALALEHDLAISGSLDTLVALASGVRPGRYRLFLGYSGWAPGQLEQEIEENSWLVAPLDPALIFEVPVPSRWERALRSIGVDPGTLVDAGSATPS